MIKNILHATLLVTLGFASSVSAGCPPIDPASLWLPKDKEFARKQFINKAKKLNDAGQCVIEGSFGRAYKKFYITVSKTGSVKDAQILRFTFEELKK